MNKTSYIFYFMCDYLPHKCYDITKAEQRRMTQYCRHYRRSDKEVWTVML